MAKKDKPKTSDNGQDNKMLEVLQVMARNQEELANRLADVEEAAHKKDSGSNLIKLANWYFNPDDSHLPDLTFISPLSAKPLAEALALDEMTTEKVRSGEVSLNRLLIFHWFHLQRGVKGRLLGLGAEAMREQVSSESTKEEGLDEFEAGRE
jgi:hypothetical protein